MTGVFVAAAVVFFAYSGFEAVANLGEETKDPAKDMPRGLLGTLAICTVLYVLVCLVITGMVKYTGLSEGAPISDAFDQVGMGWASILIAVAAIAGLSSVILVDIVAMGRIGFALCRDGLLPAWIGQVHREVADAVPRHHRHDGRGDAAGRLRPARRAGRDGQHRHAVRVLRRLDRGDRAAPHPARMKRPFRTPQVPLLPIVSALCCVGLMTNLALETWLRFLVWLVVGLVDLLVLRPHPLPARDPGAGERARRPLTARTGTRRRPALVSGGDGWLSSPGVPVGAAAGPSSRAGLEADRQPGVVLRQPGRPGHRRRHPPQLGELELLVEVVAGGVQHRGHPPGEVGAPPDPAQGVVGVGVRQRRATRRRARRSARGPAG